MWSSAWDQGPDNVATFFFLMAIGMHLISWWDFSHGADNEFKSMLQDISMYKFWALFVCVLNAPCGPETDCTRWLQLNQAWHHLFSIFTAGNCYLVQNRSVQLLEEIGGVDVLDTCDGDIDQRLFDYLKKHAPYNGPEMKSNMVRFNSTPRKAREFLKRWHRAGLNFEYLALEEGMLATRKLDLGASTRGLDNDSARPSTEISKPSITDKLDASGGAVNAITIGTMMTAEVDHEIFIRCICSARVGNRDLFSWCI